MSKIQSFISDDLLVEGLFGAISLYISRVLFKNYLDVSLYVEAAIGWTLIWYSRKFGLTLYKSYKNKNGIKSRNFYLINY